LGLIAFPPCEDICVYLLIDDPLLPSVREAKVACLRPSGQMVDSVVEKIAVTSEFVGLSKVTILGTQPSNGMALRLQLGAKNLP
jgi:hypothetical protein